MKVKEKSIFIFYNLNYVDNLKKFEYEKNTKFKFEIEIYKKINNLKKINFKFVKNI